jgi:hypothetical protein
MGKGRKRGRPKQFFGPMLNIKFSALTHAQIVGLASFKGQSVSQVIRDCLRESMDREFGPPGGEERCNETF